MSVILHDRRGNAFDLRPIVCPTCGDVPQITLGQRGGRHHRYGLGVETTIVKCSRCSLLFPNPFPYPQDPQRLYSSPDTYFPSGPLEEKISYNRSVVRELQRRAGRTSLRLLDIGSGRGDFLQAARLEGIDDFVGLEFSQAMIEYAAKTFGITLLPRSIEDFAAGEVAPFDAVTLNAVLEHVYNPDSFMSAVSRLIRPGGLLYIDIPQEPHLLATVGNSVNRLLRRPGVYNLQPTWEPFHVFGFNPKAMRTLLAKHGFRIEALRVHANTEIPASGQLRDRLRAFVGKQINRVANLTGTASNMFIWARDVRPS